MKYLKNWPARNDPKSCGIYLSETYKEFNSYFPIYLAGNETENDIKV